MTTQPEALRLADELERDKWHVPAVVMQAAADELRRLHAENESLRQIVQDFPPVEAELREVSDRAHRLEAQRDALLEALELAADFLEHSTEFRIGHPGFEQAQAKARAAIKAVEGEKT